MPARISLIVFICLALSVAGCGRRGDLEPPSGAPARPAGPGQQARPPKAGAPDGLFRNTGATPEKPEPAKAATSSGKSTPFVLDPLL